jgi:hypothetical protein
MDRVAVDDQPLCRRHENEASCDRVTRARATLLVASTSLAHPQVRDLISTPALSPATRTASFASVQEAPKRLRPSRFRRCRCSRRRRGVHASAWRPDGRATALLGMLFGGLIVGAVTDKFGRQKVYVAEIACVVLLGAADSAPSASARQAR